RSFQRLAHLRQALEQRGAVRRDQPGNPAQHVRPPGRQMELAYADIDPHVAGASIEEGDAGEAETGDVGMGRQVLVADADIDVPEMAELAGILVRGVELLVCHGPYPPPTAEY